MTRKPQPADHAAARDAVASALPRAGWRALGQRLYVRIWLAVVMAVAVLTLLVGWAWRLAAEPPLRELQVRNAAGEVIGTAQRRMPMDSRRDTPGVGQGMGPGTGSGRGNGRSAGPEFLVNLQDGQVLHIHLPRPQERSFFGMRTFGAYRPYGFLWLLGLVGLAVALGTYPVVRRLTKRLETLQQGVEQWGSGDLSARVALQGDDEIGHLAKRFNLAAGRIETLVKSHKSLLANASHELRSPLTRIRMGLELMGDTTSPAFRDEITRNIAELDQLVDEILLASRLDAQEADIGTVEQVDLTGLVAEECARQGALFDALFDDPAGPADDRRALERELPPVLVQGVVKLLRRVVRNLLENARRYSSGDILVRLQREGGFGVLRVCDSGPGVPPELRERIFEPFYRLPGASEHAGGVGLGLALVKSITLRMGGTVHCEANPGGGACFVVRLPLAPGY
jgi:signal transduction histidine kinase